MDGTRERSNDFGGRLKRLREDRGVTLRAIAERTKVSVSVLEALERNDISRLPGGIFSRGIVRAYAEQVGAEPDAAVREFAARFSDDTDSGPGPFASVAVAETPAPVVRPVLITLALALPVAAAIVWAMLANG